jgi:hypothetical protein
MSEANPAKVMLALRDHRANDVESLCRLLNVSPSYGRFQLENVLRELEGAGLIVHTGPPGTLSGSFEVTPSWNRIQGTLGLSLTKLVEGGSDTMTVRPTSESRHGWRHLTCLF